SQWMSGAQKSGTGTEDYKTGWQHALADYQNLKRETDAKRVEWVQDAQIRALHNFLPIYENMRKAFAHLPQGESSSGWTAWANGCKQILKQFDEVLKQMNVEPIKTVGTQFDPRLHEALAERDDGKPSGEILEEAEAGFKSGERIIKPAKVIINK